MDLMSQIVNELVVLDMVMDSADLPILQEAAEKFDGRVEEIAKNKTNDLLTINREHFNQGIIPVGKSGFQITLPSELRGKATQFWTEVNNLRERSTKKETE